MDKNIRLESVMAKALKGLNAANQLLYSDPEQAVNLLNTVDENIHIAHDEICSKVKLTS